MMHDNHGWNDDEETIINFTPKGRPVPDVSAQQSMPAYPRDVLEPGVVAGSSATEHADTAPDQAGPAAPPLASMATPPPSRPYGGGTPPNSARPSAGAADAAETVVTAAGQDPYLANADANHAFSSGGKGILVPPLPSGPPILELGHVPRNAAVDGTPPPVGFQPSMLPDPPLPGFRTQPHASNMPAPPAEAVSNSPGALPLAPAPIFTEPWRQTPMPLFIEHRGPGNAMPGTEKPVSQDMPSAQPIEAEPSAAAEAPARDPLPETADPRTEDAGKPAFRADIDPPTIMDVPLMARRVLEVMEQGEGRPTPDALRSDAAAENRPLESPLADHALDPLTPDPTTVSEEGPGIRGDVAVPAAVPPAQTRADQEWASPCEAGVAASPAVNAPEPTESRVDRTEGEQSAARSLDLIEAARQPASGPDDFQIEPAMERTNLRLPTRVTEAVQDVAWVVILASPSAHIHKMYLLDAIRMELGRSFDAPIFVDDKTISSRHAAIRYERVNDQFEFVLYDLASTNGTYVNGAPIHVAVLKDNDRIRVGETDLVFKKVGDPPAALQ